jgi:hypothetical protein
MGLLPLKYLTIFSNDLIPVQQLQGVTEPI